MLENLESVTLNEELKVIDKQAYAVIPLLGKKRKVNGCEARVMVNNEIKTLENDIKVQEAELAKKKTLLASKKKLDTELAFAGYCLLDNPLYKKVDGIRIKDKDGNYLIEGMTHSDTCSHREG